MTNTLLHAGKFHIALCADAEEVARCAADRFWAAARSAIATRGVFRAAVSGGCTPARFFENLSADPFAQDFPWKRAHLFWVDERYVAQDAPDSNYRMVHEAFLRRVALPADHVHPIPTHFADIGDAVAHYQQTLRQVFGLTDGQVPVFDWVLLGMGADGHTASLFPGTDPVLDADVLACATHSPVPPYRRLTLSAPVLRTATELVMMITGPEKRRTFQAVMTGKPDPSRYPVQLLWPVLDRVTWCLDRAAAPASMLGP